MIPVLSEKLLAGTSSDLKKGHIKVAEGLFACGQEVVITAMFYAEIFSSCH